MKYKNILVVHKKPLLEIYENKSKEELDRLIEENDWDKEDLEEELQEHKITRKIVKKTLSQDKNVKVDCKYRANLSKELLKNYDLIIPFGGDGTLIEVSHYIFDNTPVFGINSDYRPNNPESSEGFRLSATKLNFEDKYKQLQEGKLKEFKFPRLQAELNEQKLEELILNEVFIAHKDSSATTRILVKDKGLEEFQKHDGMIIATPSSNWPLLYGGEIIPLTDRKISYVTRGLFVGRLNQDPKLEKGVTESIEVYSKIREGMIAIDGRHNKYDFGLADKLKVTISDKPLTIIGFDPEKRKFYIPKA